MANLNTYRSVCVCLCVHETVSEQEVKGARRQKAVNIPAFRSQFEVLLPAVGSLGAHRAHKLEQGKIKESHKCFEGS